MELKWFLNYFWNIITLNFKTNKKGFVNLIFSLTKNIHFPHSTMILFVTTTLTTATTTIIATTKYCLRHCHHHDHLTTSIAITSTVVVITTINTNITITTNIVTTSPIGVTTSLSPSLPPTLLPSPPSISPPCHCRHHHYQQYHLCHRHHPKTCPWLLVSKIDIVNFLMDHSWLVFVGDQLEVKVIIISWKLKFADYFRLLTKLWLWFMWNLAAILLMKRNLFCF